MSLVPVPCFPLTQHTPAELTSLLSALIQSVFSSSALCLNGELQQEPRGGQRHILRCHHVGTTHIYRKPYGNSSTCAPQPLMRLPQGRAPSSLSGATATASYLKEMLASLPSPLSHAITTVVSFLYKMQNEVSHFYP